MTVMKTALMGIFLANCLLQNVALKLMDKNPKPESACETGARFSKIKSWRTNRTHERRDYAIMVPTHPGHLHEFENLVASYHKHYEDQNRIRFVAVFTDTEECKQMLEQCRSCKDTSVETMIFDHPYKQSQISPGKEPYEYKFNFQAAKKLWALDNMPEEHV